MRTGIIVVKVMLIVGLLGTLATLITREMVRGPIVSLARETVYLTPTAADITLALHRVGLSPENLAAAGVTAQQTAGIVDAMESLLNGEPGLVKSKEDALGEARNECDRLVRRVRSGEASGEEVTRCAQARADLLEAEGDLEATLDELFGDLIESLGETTRVKLALLRDNATWALPLEFRVVDRDIEDWVELRQALANERTAPLVGEEPSEAAETLLSNARADVAVALAKTNLDSNLGNILTSWEAALPNG